MKTFKEQLGYPLLAFLLCLFGTSVEGAQLPPPPATQAEVNAGTGTYKYVTPATLAGWTGGPSGGVTGMKTNTFTTFSDGQWQLFTNIPDGSLCFSNLTYPQFVLMLRTNGSLLLTNSTTGASNVVSAAGWSTMSGGLSNAALYVSGNAGLGGETQLYHPHSPQVNLNGGFGTADRTMLFADATGNLRLTDNAQTTFGRLIFGLATAAFPALQRSGGNLILTDGAGTGTTNSLIVAGSVTGTNGVIVSSNSWVNQPALAEGQAVFLSSNGVPHVVWKVGGVLTTNNLTATGAADGVGISTNGGSGIDNVFTNATLNDASGINTFRPSTREVVNSSGNVVADFDARNLNGTSGNALNWSADGTLVRVFNDLQIDGHLTTPAALVSNTPATDQILVYSSPTTAKATSTISPSAVNTVDFSVSGLYAVTNAITLLQFHASNVPTNNILPSSASGTNWTFCVVGGLPRMIATNYAAAGAFIKCVGETVSVWP